MNPASFTNVKTKVRLFRRFPILTKTQWYPEVHHHCPEAKIVLVGTKCDLKDDQASLAKLAQSGQSPITQQMGEQMAKEVGAVAYMECSALTQKGLKLVFDEAIKCVIFPKKAKGKKKGGCLIQ